MLSGKITDRIELQHNSDIHLRPGDYISLKVVKNIFHNKWAVSIGGRLLTAYSDIDLIPGQIIKAKVLLEENRLILKITNKNIDTVNVLLEKYGINSDSLTRSIVLSLMRTGLAVREEYIIAIKSLIKNSKKAETKLIRLLAIMLDKGIIIKHLDMERILPLIYENSQYKNSQSDRREKGEKRKKEQRRAKRTEELKKYIFSRLNAVSDSENNLLQIFNQIKATHDNWLITPFRIKDGKETLSGSIRIQYDYFQKTVNRIVIQCSFNSVNLSFYLRNVQGGYSLSVFCNEQNYTDLIKRELPKLSIKLQNLRVKIDDTILEDTFFDGFSLEEPENIYKPIDTVG
ncbi:MAG: hypothetical protein J7K04_15930 [Spirochaetales bacterium]|nr:hypothetical protein [Spirochaetales bacterium]